MALKVNLAFWEFLNVAKITENFCYNLSAFKIQIFTY